MHPEEEKVSIFSKEAQKKDKPGIYMEQTGIPGEVNLLNAKHKFSINPLTLKFD
jgi:hypothetical protein